MNIRQIFFLLILSIQLGCKEKKSDHVSNANAKQSSDTLVGHKIITDEIPGSSYRKRAIGYFVITNADTSDLMFVFSEGKVGGKVTLYFRQNEKVDMTYRQKLTELNKILPDVADEFNLDSLSSIYIGRLVSNGDIAIDVTEDFLGSGISPRDSRSFTTFMKESKLAKDLDQVFINYDLQVHEFALEKFHFTSKETLLWASKVERDSTSIPDKIIDCLTWISMRSSK